MICFKVEGVSERRISMTDELLKDRPAGSPSPLAPGGARETSWIHERAHCYFSLPYGFRLQAVIPRGCSLNHRLMSLF